MLNWKLIGLAAVALFAIASFSLTRVSRLSPQAKEGALLLPPPPPAPAEQQSKPLPNPPKTIEKKADSPISNPRIKEGSILSTDRITFEKEIKNLGKEYLIKYLPTQSTTYNKKTYQVIPISIWWHWDATPNPKDETTNAAKVYLTQRILAERTASGDPVGTHFVVGPGVVLQMLPMSTTKMTQGRLTNDHDIENVAQAPSLAGIQIETTGINYDQTPPLPIQTQTLIEFTAILMKQYHITFANILGHLERAPGLGKTDPGIDYLKETRIKLLKYLIAQKQWKNIGASSTWNFYTEVKDGKEITKVIDQTPNEILSALTEEERGLLQ